MDIKRVRSLRSDDRWERLLSRAPILRLVGNTPLIDVAGIDVAGIDNPKSGAPNPRVRVLAKLESFNPGGSVKDRPALSMVMAAMLEGRLTAGKVLLDSTSGNTGIAYAMIGAALGFPVELCLPENASEERKKLIQAYGTRIHFTDPLEGSEGARTVAQQMFEGNPETYFLPDQYNNANNSLAHYETTGPEIWRATDGRVTHFLAGIGTSGTLMGAGRYLKAQNPEIKVYAIEPDNPLHGLEGLKHMETAMVPGIYDSSWLDGVLTVSTEEAYRQVGRLAQRGILVGASSGGALAAATRLADEVEEGVIVTIFPDGGGRYLSTGLFEMVSDV